MDAASMPIQLAELPVDRFGPEWVKPSGLTIEPCTRCQLRCPECPNTGYGAPLGWGHLPFSDFKRLLDDNTHFRRCYLTSFGELFLNPDLLPIIEYASERGVELSLDAVNFNWVRDGVLEGLVKCGVGSLVVALDGATPETYRTYRVGGDFDRVAKNIRELNRLKEVHHSRVPQLIWQFVVFGHNEHEIPLAQELARQWDMTFRARLAWNTDFSPIRDPEVVKRRLGWSSATREEFIATQGRRDNEQVCVELWRSPKVNWDGSVLGCCWTQKGFGGNAFRDGYLAAINNEKIRYARKMLLGEVPPRDDIVCAGCRLFKGLATSGGYLTLRDIEGEPRETAACR